MDEPTIRRLAEKIQDLCHQRASGSLTIHFSQGTPTKTEVRLFETLDSVDLQESARRGIRRAS